MDQDPGNPAHWVFRCSVVKQLPEFHGFSKVDSEPSILFKKQREQHPDRVCRSELNYFKVLAREKIRKIEILESLTGFDEVNLGLIVDGALKEATRHFQC